jgi:sugar lactone lactonase YvrE
MTDSVIESTATVAVEGLYFGEAPRWHKKRLWYSDFFAHTICSMGRDGSVRIEVQHAPNVRSSGLGWLPDGRLLFVSMIDRRVVRREHDGSLATHANLWHLATFHCNDMVVDRHGRAYVGNFGFDLDTFTDEQAAGRTDGVPFTLAALALVHANGRVESAATDLAFPNGMVITPDGGTLIVAESFAAKLTAFDIMPGGSLRNRRVWAELPGVAPDGICLDADGHVWVANALAPEAIRVAEGGSITHRVDTGDRCFACMLDDFGTLFCIVSKESDHVRAAAAPTGSIRTATAPSVRAGWP